jgi:uncharacterized repeat protein (TIGR01451 family)
MTSRQRIIALFLVGLVGCWALSSFPQGGDVHAHSAPVLATQFVPSTPEPPLAGMPLPPRGGMALPIGTPYPVDPPVPVVSIRVRVAAQSAPKQEIEYRICVRNTSTAPAHHVLVRNPLPSNARYVRANPEPARTEPEVQWQLGTVLPGACHEILLVLAPTTDEDVRNCARVQFEHGQCVTTRIGGTPSPPAPMPLPPGGAKLTVALTGPVQQYANLPAKYQLTIRNEGTGPASSVVLSNLLPAQTKLISAGPGGQLHMQQVAWQIGSLEAGGTRTVQFVLRAETAGEFVNRATVLWDRGQRAETEFRTRFVGTSALHMEVVDKKDPIAVGGQTTYVITVLNQGSAAATNVQVSVLVPPELKLIQAKSDKAKPPEKEDLPAPTKFGQELTFATIKELPAGQQARYEVFVEAVQAGDVRFSVRMNADQLKSGPVIEEESTRVVPNK